MNQIEFITELYESVPKDKRDAFIAEVAESAAQYQPDTGLSPEQMAELRRRALDPDAKYVSGDYLTKKYGVKFPS